jgi:hypothetical protein
MLILLTRLPGKPPAPARRTTGMHSRVTRALPLLLLLLAAALLLTACGGGSGY